MDKVNQIKNERKFSDGRVILSPDGKEAVYCGYEVKLGDKNTVGIKFHLGDNIQWTDKNGITLEGTITELDGEGSSGEDENKITYRAIRINQFDYKSQSITPYTLGLTAQNVEELKIIPKKTFKELMSPSSSFYRNLNDVLSTDPLAKLYVNLPDYVKKVLQANNHKSRKWICETYDKYKGLQIKRSQEGAYFPSNIGEPLLKAMMTKEQWQSEVIAYWKARSIDLTSTGLTGLSLVRQNARFMDKDSYNNAYQELETIIGESLHGREKSKAIEEFIDRGYMATLHDDDGSAVLKDIDLRGTDRQVFLQENKFLLQGLGLESVLTAEAMLNGGSLQGMLTGFCILLVSLYNQATMKKISQADALLSTTKVL